MKIIKNSMIMKLSLLALSLSLFSFTGDVGGDVCEVYIGNTLLVQRFMVRDKEVPSIALPGQSKEQLSVVYNHCGQPGHARSISLKAANDKVLKTWRFSDSAEGKIDHLNIDFAEFEKVKGKGITTLVYTSTEIPHGTEIVKLNSEASASTARVD